MPETALDISNRIFREFRRYTGDGLPGEPTNAPLPVGDPQSGPHNPKKSELRLGLRGIIQAMLDSVAYVDGVLPEIDEARAAALVAIAESRDDAIDALHAEIDPLVEQAEAARDIAAGYASDAVSQGNVPIYATAVGIAALNIPPGINAFRTNGYYAAGDGGAALYRLRSAPEANAPGDLTSDAGTKRWALVMGDWVNVRQFGAKGDALLVNGACVSGTDDTSAIRAAVATGRNVLLTPTPDQIGANYLLSDEIECITSGQIISGLGAPSFIDGGNIGLAWPEGGIKIVAASTFTARVRTRRKFRGSSSDPEDDPLSVMFNIQNNAVHFKDLVAWLSCDYSDTDLSNLGDDVDVAFFIGCRTRCSFERVYALGYFRKAAFYIDVTQGSAGSGMPRFNSLAGTPYPSGNSSHNADGNTFRDCFYQGARQGLVVLGALPKVGATTYGDPYYDAILAATVADDRGSAGASDTTYFGGIASSVKHHSGSRLEQPNGGLGSLSYATMAAEPENAPSVCYVDGLTSTGFGIQNVRFVETRIRSNEMFCFRFKRANRLHILDSHIEGMNSTSDYGYYAGNDSSGTVWAIGVPMNTLTQFAPFTYDVNKIFMEADRGRLWIPDYLEFTQGARLTGANGNFNISVGGASKAVVSPTQFQIIDGLRLGPTATTSPLLSSGLGSPEGVVTAPPGSCYFRRDGGSGDLLFYVKVSGTGNTGWLAAKLTT